MNKRIYNSLIGVLMTMLTLLPTASMAQSLTMGFIYPAGGAQGSSVDIEIGGLNLQNASSVVISGEGITTEIIPLPPPEPTYIIGANGVKRKVSSSKTKLNDQSAPQLADRVGVRVHIAPDAEVGLRDLRLQSSKGVSNQLSFEVSPYPNYLESRKLNLGEVNRVESLPTTLCGYVQPGEVDRFSFEAKAGSTIVAEVKGRTLVPYIADAVPGWFQPVIKLLDERGREVAFADDFHTSPDPVMVVEIPHDGEYTLTINDAIFRGRQDFNYRIQIGEIPFVDELYPLVATMGKSSTLNVSGVNLKETTIEVTPTKAGINYLRVEGLNGELSNRVPYYAVATDEQIIYASTADNKESTLSSNHVIYNNISTPYEQQRYTLPLKANESIVLDAMARRIDSRADLRLTLISPEGELIIESDDVEDSSQGLMTHHADPVINYTAKAAGDFTLIVEDIQGRAGRDHSYILRKMRPSAPFEAFVSPANITISQGGTASFTVKFNFKSRNNVPGVGTIKLDGLPEGYVVSSLTPGRFPKTWEISVTAPKSAEIGTFPIDVKVLTFPQRRGEQMEVSANASDNMMQAFYYTHHIPATAFTAEIVPAIPFSVGFEPEIERDLKRPITINDADTLLPIKILIDRKAGFDKEIELTLSKKTKAISLDPVTVSPDESEKVIYLKIHRAVIDGLKSFSMPIYISATVNGEIQTQGKRTFVNALYRDMTPIITLQKEGMPLVSPYDSFMMQQQNKSGSTKSVEPPKKGSTKRKAK